MKQRALKWIGAAVLAACWMAAQTVQAEPWRLEFSFEENLLVFYQTTDFQNRTLYVLEQAGDADLFELFLDREPERKWEITWGEADEWSAFMEEIFHIKILRTVVFRSDLMTPKRWADLAAVDTPFRFELLGVTNEQIPGLVRELAKLKNLDGVLMKLDDGVTDEGLAPLAQVKNLVALDFSACRKVTEAGVAALKGSNAMWKLRTPNQATDAWMKAAAASFPNLEILRSLSNDRLTDEGLAAASALKLRELNVSFCVNLTDQGLKSLQGTPSLEYLFLNGCRKFTHDGVKALTEMPNLQTVLLYGWGSQIKKVDRP